MAPTKKVNLSKEAWACLLWRDVLGCASECNCNVTLVVGNMALHIHLHFRWCFIHTLLMFSFLWDVTTWLGKNVFCRSYILVTGELMEEDYKSLMNSVHTKKGSRFQIFWGGDHNLRPPWISQDRQTVSALESHQALPPWNQSPLLCQALGQLFTLHFWETEL